MITIGQGLPTVKLLTALPKKFEPVDDAFGEFSNISHPDKWKVIYFYPKDFTFICPTEILGFDSIQRSGEAVVYGGSVDNEHVKLAWKRANPEMANIEHELFSDPGGIFARAMGVLDTTSGVANRATFIFDPKNICQHVSVNAMDTGRNHTEILRTLLALKAGGLTSCSWEPGEELL